MRMDRCSLASCGSSRQEEEDEEEGGRILPSRQQRPQHPRKNNTSNNNSNRRKYRTKAAIQSTCFLALTVGFMVYDGFVNSSDNWWSRDDWEDASWARDLAEAAAPNNSTTLPSCADIPVADPGWLCVFYSIGVLYMFLALAIVCDEFFVPALEEMSGPRRLNLSMDVAGATLMAAGGSAPELFSSLVGTFTESDIGIGTIIGSAVFNVLFVIAMCAMFAREVLNLTWWPLFRDSSFYAVGLLVLSIFLGVTSPGHVELWEAIVLFVLYIFYCLIMWKNHELYKMFTGKELEDPEEGGDNDEKENGEDKNTAETFGSNNEDPERAVEPELVDTDNEAVTEEAEEAPLPSTPAGRPTLGDKNPSASGSVASAVSIGALHEELHQQHKKRQGVNYNFRWHGTFRAGILKLLRHPHSWVTTGGVGIVSKIAGDAECVFQQLDVNGDGHIDKDELRALFEILECNVSEEELTEVFAELDADGDGEISRDEFNRWYSTSVELIKSQVRHIFDALDANNSGTLDKFELKALLLELDPVCTDADVNSAIEAMYKEGSREEITFDEFDAWYQTSMIYERQKHAVEEDAEGAMENLKPPFGEGFFTWLQYLVVLPLVFVMVFTIPDVRRPGWGRWCYLSFIISICWIGGFSYLMVSWTEIIGNTIGIPSVIMGLTVLAAGTSVPDLLSSVIVARRGQGDMAVSSSIGSNIFDILVGLPIPWILYTAWPTTPSTVQIGTKNIWINILVLLGMLVFVIAAIHCQGWKLTKTLGVMMLVFYVIFLVQAIVIELPFETCV